MTTNQLPPLPPAAHRGPNGTGAYFDSFTADQMHAYALAAIAQQAQEPSHVAALTAIASGDLGGLRYLESNEAAIERMQFIARSALKTESSEKENTCTNGTQSILPSQQSAEKRAATATLADGFQGHQGRAAPMQAGQSQGEPFAHIVVINTADAGPTKFFTAPSDPRGIAVYTTPPAPQPAPVDELPDLNPEDIVVDVVLKQLGGFAPVTTHGVRVTHKPSRVSVVVDSERSQHQNRQLALEALRAILAHAARLLAHKNAKP